MGEIFLSASVPIVGRGEYHETANPFLIQCAVRELIVETIREFKIVWGGHPAITPMIRVICEDLGVDYFDSVILYQSRYFEKLFPKENMYFPNTILVDAVSDNREESLDEMRKQMLARKELIAAVFIGGMEGVEIEFEMFREFHPGAKIMAVPSTGGAALDLAKHHAELECEVLDDVDFASMFHRVFRQLR